MWHKHICALDSFVHQGNFSKQRYFCMHHLVKGDFSYSKVNATTRISEKTCLAQFMIAGLFDHNFMNNIEGNSKKLSRLKEVLSGDKTALLTDETTPSSPLQQVFLLLSNHCKAKNITLMHSTSVWHKWEKAILCTRFGCNFLMQILTSAVASLQVEIQHQNITYSIYKDIQ